MNREKTPVPYSCNNNYKVVMAMQKPKRISLVVNLTGAKGVGGVKSIDLLLYKCSCEYSRNIYMNIIIII